MATPTTTCLPGSSSKWGEATSINNFCKRCFFHRIADNFYLVVVLHLHLLLLYSCCSSLPASSFTVGYLIFCSDNGTDNELLVFVNWRPAKHMHKKSCHGLEEVAIAIPSTRQGRQITPRFGKNLLWHSQDNNHVNCSWKAVLRSKQERRGIFNFLTFQWFIKNLKMRLYRPHEMLKVFRHKKRSIQRTVHLSSVRRFAKGV